MKKLLFVYNPHSGKGKIGSALSGIVSVFTQNGFEVTVYPTSAPQDGENHIAENSGKYDLVVVGGGDGMLHELLGGLRRAGTGTPCGYIPSGTINDFARSLGIPKNPLKAAETAVSGNYKIIDSGSYNGNIFSYVAAFGVFTDVGYTTDQKMKNAIGPLAYYLDVLHGMDLKNFRSSSVRAVLSVNGQVYEDDFIFAIVGNTHSVAGLTALIPDNSSMQDGLLDYTFLKTPKSISDIELLQSSLLTRRFDPSVIISGHAEKLTVTTERSVKWTLDGEFGGETETSVLCCLPKAVKIAVPAEKTKKTV